MEKIMRRAPKLVVVLPETDELLNAFDGWPDSILLAVCLLPTGEHHFVVFHADEANVFLKRLGSKLGLSCGQIQVFPEVDGYLARPVLFSEIQLVLALIADDVEILEEACDYAANYNFAREEGLDPARFLGVHEFDVPDDAQEVTLLSVGAIKAEVGEDEPSDDLHFASRGGPAVLFTSHRAAALRGSTPTEVAVLPSFLKQDRARPGPEFLSLSELGKLRPAESDRYVVEPEADGWIQIRRADSEGTELRVINQNQIFLRTESQDLAIRVPILPRAQQNLPGRILIDAGILPFAVRQAWGRQRQSVTLKGSGYFFFLSPDPVGRAGDLSAPLASHRAQAGGPSLYPVSASKELVKAVPLPRGDRNDGSSVAINLRSV